MTQVKAGGRQGCSVGQVKLAKMNRREFIKSSALAAAGFLLPRPLQAAPTWTHRIVRTHHPLASYFDVVNFEYQDRVPESYYGNFVNARLVGQMFDAGLCTLTGDSDPVTAMRKLVVQNFRHRACPEWYEVKR